MFLKDYLEQLYDYNYWANKRYLTVAETLIEEQLFRRQGQSWDSVHAVLMHSPLAIPAFLAETPATAAMAEPFLYGDRLLGAITVDNGSTGRSFSEHHSEVLALLANHAAIAIANAQLYAEVKRANDAKGRFVSEVAHELAQPVTAIKGFNDLLVKGMAGPVNDMQKQFLSTVQYNTERLNTLIKDLLDIGRIEPGRLKMEIAPVAIKLIVEQTIRSLQSQIDERQISVELHVLPLAILILIGSMAICSVLGFTIEKLAYKPLRKSPKLTILITAIGVSLFLEYSGQLVFGADPKSFPSLLENKSVLNLSGAVIGSNQLVVLITAGLLIYVLRLIVMKTKIGTAMRAVSYNPTAASLMGININSIISFTFLIGSSLAGAAGILYGLNYPSIDPLMGILPGIKAFVAAVLGGIGNIPGAAVGGMIIGLLETFVTGYISPTFRDAIAFGILILILLFKPTGLFGKKGRSGSPPPY